VYFSRQAFVWSVEDNGAIVHTGDNDDDNLASLDFSDDDEDDPDDDGACSLWVIIFIRFKIVFQRLLKSVIYHQI
jgi:hypothetical protein